MQILPIGSERRVVQRHRAGQSRPHGVVGAVDCGCGGVVLGLPSSSRLLPFSWLTPSLHQAAQKCVNQSERRLPRGEHDTTREPQHARDHHSELNLCCVAAEKVALLPAALGRGS